MAVQIDEKVICREQDIASECSTCVALSGRKFSAIRSALELPLKQTCRYLQNVDSDLAELAAHILEQANRFVDSIESYEETQSGTDKEKNSTPRCGNADEERSVKQEANKGDGNLSELLEQLKFLHQNVLNLSNCTDVVHDHQLMMFVLAGEKQQHGAEACRHALKQLGQVHSTLRFLHVSME